MNKKKSAWGYPHAPAVTRWSIIILAFALCGVLLAAGVPVVGFAEGMEQGQIDPAVAQVKELMDALPEEITPENAETVARQLEAIGAAKDALTEEQQRQLDFSCYNAALTAWEALTGGNNGADTLDAETGAFSAYCGTSSGYYASLESTLSNYSFSNDMPLYVTQHDNAVETGSPSVYSGTLYLTVNASLTLNNGFSISGGEVNLDGSGEMKGTVSVTGGTLNLSDLSGVHVETLSVTGGTLNVSNGTVDKLEVVENSTVKLSGGQFSTINCPGGRALPDLLEVGYAFQNCPYEKLVGTTSLSGDLNVVKCSHPQVEKSGDTFRCLYCNAEVAPKAGVSSYELPDVITAYYMSLQEAIDHAQSAYTIRLFGDESGTVTIPDDNNKRGITLDLNGYSIHDLKAKSYCHLKNSDGTKGGNIGTFEYPTNDSGVTSISTETLCKEGSWIKKNNDWAGKEVTLDNGTLTNFQVCATPIQKITVTPGAYLMIHPGESEELKVNVTTLPGTTGDITYQWSDDSGDLGEGESYRVRFNPDEEGQYDDYKTYTLSCVVTYAEFSRTVKVTVDMKKWDISEMDKDITLPEQPVYDGDWHEMNYEGIQWNGRTLTCNVDYTVTWDLNRNAAIDVEEKTVTIRGVGKYMGEREVKWSLQKAATVPDTYVKSVESNIYYGKDHTGDNRVAVPLPELPKGGMVTNIQLGEAYREGTTDQYGYTIFPSGQTEVVEGTLYYSVDQTREPVYANITLTVESQNYKPYTITVRVNLVNKTQVTIRGTMTGDGQLVYNQTAQAPEITLTVEPNVRVETSYYEYSEDEQDFVRIPGKPKDVGQYKVVYSVPESNELYTGEPQAFEYSITPKDITVHGIEGIRKPYDGNRLLGLDFKNVTLTGVFDGDQVEVNGVTADDACYFEDASAGVDKKVTINPEKLQMQGDDAGNYRIAAEGSQTETKATIEPKTVTVSGLKVDNKIYNGTVTGTVNYDDVSIADIVGRDNLTLAHNAKATFETASAGNSKTVTVSGLTLSGTSAGNYRLSSTEVLTEANIDRRAVVVYGIEAESKDYDGTTTATLKYGNIQFNDKIEGDDLTVTADGQFEIADAGTNKTVVIRNHRLGGAAKDNYDLQMPAPQTTTATIRPRVVTVTGLTADKTYDGTTTATLTGTPQAGNLVGSDKVTLSIENAEAAFDNKNAGTNKTVTVPGSHLKLEGAAKDNYTLPQTFTLTAAISRKEVTVTGVSAKNKEYDGTVNAEIDGTATTADFVPEDDVQIDASNAKATFANKNATWNETGKTVTFSGYALTGADAGNYNLNQPANAEAIIRIKKVYIENVRVLDKEYDGTIAATADYSGVRLRGVVEGEDVWLSTEYAGAYFLDAAVGSGKTVDIIGLSLAGDDSKNYAYVSPAFTASITPKTVTLEHVAVQTKTYDGTVDADLDFSPEIAAVKVGNEDLQITGTGEFLSPDAGTDVAVRFHSVTLSGADKDNYTLPNDIPQIRLKGTVTKAPAPTAAPGSLTVANGYAGSYTVDLSRLLPTLSAGQEYGTVTYESPTVSLGNYYGGGAAVSEDGILTLPILQNDVTSVGDVGTVTVTVRSRNFEDMILTLNVQSSNRKLPMGEPTLSPETLTYGEPLSAIALSGTMYCQEPTEVPGGEQVVTFAQTGENGRVQVPGTFTWTNPAVKPEAGSYSAQWLFTPEDPVTYLSVSGTANIQVLKAQQAAPKAPEPESRGHNSITLKAIPDNLNGAKAQYRLGDGAWQDSPTFDGLTAGEEYVFQARYGETENYIASPASGEARLASLPYVLSFQVNGGSDLDSVEAKAGTVISLSAYRPTRSGYSFAGWYAEADFRTRVTSVTLNDDTTVYARWTVRSSSSPATGDGTRLALGGTVLVLSAGALALLLAKRKKRRPER